MAADLNEIHLELLPLREPGSSSHHQHCKDEDANGPDSRTGEMIDSSEEMACRSTLLPLREVPPHADGTGRRRARVLPRVKKRLREESQRIRDKSRRWKEQKAEQRRINLKDCDPAPPPPPPLRPCQGFREMSLRQELLLRQRNQNKPRRIDSEFDILEVCQAKAPKTRSSRTTTVESGGFDTSLRRNGNDVQTLIEKDGKKKSDMAVYFDKEDATYSTGDTIKGHVNITLTQDVRVKDLKLQIYGNGRVSWGEQRSYIKGSAPKVLLRNNEVFLDHSMTLMKIDGGLFVRMPNGRRGSSNLASTEAAGAAEESVYLPAGVHNYPFEFDLPHDLPGSFEGRWGQVRYGVKATLVRPWKFDIEREKDFTLRCLIDLNEEPELARPIGALGEFSPGLMCIRSGAVTVELRIGRRGYVPGESIQFYVEVENNSRRKLQDTSVALVQHVTYRAGKKMRKTSANVATLRKGETLPYSTVVWNTESVLIPSSPGTSCKYYKGIQIKYVVSLLVKYSSWADAFCLSVPIVLGTTGLRRQTINTYLSMLGYCQTPRGSPANGRRNSNGQVAAGIRPSTRQSLTAPCIAGNIRHSSISSLQSVSKPRRSSPVGSTTRPRRDTAALALSSSKDNGLIGGDSSSLTVALSKSGAARSRLSAQLKPKSKSLDSTDKEEEEKEEEERRRVQCEKKNEEEDDVFTKPDDNEGKRTGVK